jgi:heterotetrameric sarcosine oxidase gamma subunit
MWRASAIVTDVSISVLPPTPLYALDIWANTTAVAARFEKAFSFALPCLGRSAGNSDLNLIRFEPTVWLAEGNTLRLHEILGDDGALTAIGGSVVRVRLSGGEWRSLLMEGSVFDAESGDFAPGCSAATIIDHVAVRLHVVNDETCDVFVPASFSSSLVHFWHEAAKTLPVSSRIAWM